MNCADCHGALTDVAGSESVGLCAACVKARAAAAASVYDLDPPSHDFGAGTHDIESAHRVARALMQESWLWNICDDGAPLGSDTGADTLSAFREWRRRHRTGDASSFQKELLRDWEVPDRDWDLLDPVALEQRLPVEDYAILTRDDVAVAPAFAQLVEEGHLSAAVKQRALVALRRQAEEVVLRFRGWGNRREREERLRVMQSVIERAGAPDDNEMPPR